MDYYIGVLKKYAVFTGRARRAEYWYFILFNIIASVLLTFLDEVLGSGWLSTIYGLAVLVPSLAVGVRRMHDIGKSGWWLFINIIPFVGWIWFIVLVVTDSQTGDNQYGPNPKGNSPSVPPSTPATPASPSVA